jgi:tRNA1Val (adenine37-N6)-methyltransferase
MTAVTHDNISLRGAGVVDIVQPKKGFRFTLDSLLLANFCCIKTRDRILELGAGTGIITLLLAKKFPQARFVADEAEPHAFDLLCQNISLNGLGDRIVPLDRDIKFLERELAPHSFDVIVANPPYTCCGSGKKSLIPERHIARQDQAAAIHLWLDRQDLLRNRGRYILVFPAGRLAELIMLLRARKLEPKRLQAVHPYQDKPASLVLVEAIKSAHTGLQICPPLIVHEHGGGYTEAMKEIYGMRDTA